MWKLFCPIVIICLLWQSVYGFCYNSAGNKYGFLHPPKQGGLYSHIEKDLRVNNDILHGVLNERASGSSIGFPRQVVDSQAEPKNSKNRCPSLLTSIIVASKKFKKTTRHISKATEEFLSASAQEIVQKMSEASYLVNNSIPSIQHTSHSTETSSDMRVLSDDFIVGNDLEASSNTLVITDVTTSENIIDTSESPSLVNITKRSSIITTLEQRLDSVKIFLQSISYRAFTNKNIINDEILGKIVVIVKNTLEQWLVATKRIVTGAAGTSDTQNPFVFLPCFLWKKATALLSFPSAVSALSNSNSTDSSSNCTSESLHQNETVAHSVTTVDDKTPILASTELDATAIKRRVYQTFHQWRETLLSNNKTSFLSRDCVLPDKLVSGTKKWIESWRQTKE